MNSEERTSERRIADYEALKREVGNLFNAGRPGDAVVLLEKEKARFPEHLYEIIFSLGYGRLITGNPSGALDAFEEGISKGLWFAFPMDAPVIQPLVGDPRFRIILATSEVRRKEAQAGSEPGVRVALPDGYAEDREYPLFIALHGWGDDLREIMDHWVSPVLKAEFLSAFFQSSQVVKMDGGRGWDDLALGRREIRGLFDEVADRYPVRPDRVLIGGFSQGGRMAIDIALNDILPVAGFIVLCPGGGVPDGLNLEQATRAADRGVRGTILTGDKDPDLAEQRRIADIFEEAGLDLSMVVREGLGHWFPEDLGDLLDKALRRSLPE